MGNRALLKARNQEIGIYLHWNGGRDSVEAFLAYALISGVRTAYADHEYHIASLSKIIGNFFSDLSIGIGVFNYKSFYEDNGVYVYDEDGFNIIERINPPDQEQYNHDFFELMKEIDDCQPEKSKILKEVSNLEELLNKFPILKEYNKEEKRKWIE